MNQFPVLLNGEDSMVTVIMGSILISRGTEQMILHEQQQVLLTFLGRPESVSKLDVSYELVWREGRLVISSERLERVIEELNLYVPQTLVLSVDKLSSKLVTAVILLEDIMRMLEPFGPKEFVQISLDESRFGLNAKIIQ